MLPYAIRHSPGVQRIAALAMPFLFFLMACDSGSLSEPPPATCSEAGVQCQLSEGPLGVCERAPCAPDATPPCFQCTPQH